MKRVKRLAVAVVAAVMILTLLAPVYAGAAQVGDKEISSKGAAVIDLETGTVLFDYNGAVQRVPASMIKIIAAHVVYDAIRDGKVTMDSRIPIRQATAALSRNRSYSNVVLNENSTYSVRSLLEVVIVRSACAATVALGEGIFGSEKAFVDLMNAKARDYNIRATFVDCWGLSPNNRISPLAMAWMTRRLLLEYPEILEIASMKEVTWEGGDPLPNTNHLLARYEGATGLKTGYTDPAGHCFIGTASRGGRMLISVTMGSSLEGRFPDTEILLDYGFANADAILGVVTQEPEPDSEPDPEPDPDPDTEPDTEPDPARPPSGMANPSAANLILNGESMPLSAYMINGSHYFKLRDIAFLLDGTGSRFEVLWNADDRTIDLIGGEAYTPEGNELVLPVTGARPYRPTQSIIYFNGVPHEFEAYIIDGYNYFRLRELDSLIGFSVRWIGATRTVIITTRTTQNAAA